MIAALSSEAHRRPLGALHVSRSCLIQLPTFRAEVLCTQGSSVLNFALGELSLEVSEGTEVVLMLQVGLRVGELPEIC